MATNKQRREYERRRQEKWAERQQDKSKRRSLLLVGGAILLILAVVAVIIVVVVVNSKGKDGTPTPPAVTQAAPETSSSPTKAVPDPSLAQKRAWTGTVSTSFGDLGIELDGSAAPQAVANFLALSRDGFFDDNACHRLTTSRIYVLQCGDPEGNGMGGPGYTWGPIENAPANNVYPAGTIAMARADTADSMGSQFFLVYKDSPIPSNAAGGYTVFGKITSGLDSLQTLAKAGTADGQSDGKPAKSAIIKSVTLK